MGWFIGPHTDKQSLVRELLVDGCIKHRLRANHLWTLQETEHKGQRVVFVQLDLLRKDRETKQWGYKTLDSDSHPYYYDCPKSFLDKMTPPLTEGGREWMQKVVEFHARQNFSVQPGMRFQLDRDTTKVVEITCKLTQASWAARYPCGQIYKVMRRTLGAQVA